MPHLQHWRRSTAPSPHQARGSVAARHAQSLQRTTRVLKSLLRLSRLRHRLPRPAASLGDEAGAKAKLQLASDLHEAVHKMIDLSTL